LTSEEQEAPQRSPGSPASPGQADAAQEDDEEKEEEEEEEEGQAKVQCIIPTSIVLSISNFLFALLLLSPGDGLA
jgi:hypothetical protein